MEAEEQNALREMGNTSELPQPQPDITDEDFKNMVESVKAQQALQELRAKQASPQLVIQIRSVNNGWLGTWQPDSPFTQPGSTQTEFAGTAIEVTQLIRHLLSE